MLRATLPLLLLPFIGHAQYFSGRFAFPQGANARVVLWSTQGADHLRLDSMRTDARGEFIFARNPLGAGFFQVSINDSDRVDVILNPAERQVSIEFTGMPLQENVHVVKSDENMRLWEYKLVSREAQAVLATADAERRTLDPTDVARARALDSIAHRAAELREHHLGRLIAAAPKSYFAKAVGAGRRMEQAAGDGQGAVLKAFDFGDPELLRSSVYARAIITYLQSGTPGSEQDFFAAVDTLMLATLRDSSCFHYTLGFLVELFSQYGPELAIPHLVDNWIVPTGGAQRLPLHIREKVADQLLVTLGRRAPELLLPDHDRTVRLSELVAASSFTTLMFYGSTCDHCREQLPLVRDQLAIYRDKGYRIVGIALDADSAEFLATIRDMGITWPVFSEFKGFGGVAVKTYQVKATPYYYLLDRNMTIVAKPVNYLELAERLREIYAR